MKRKYLLIAAAAVVLAVAGFAIFFQSSVRPQDPTAGRPDSFNFIFKYGVDAKNVLNTFDQTYTKDMVIGPAVTIKLTLTDDEMAGIYRKINDLKVFDLRQLNDGNAMVLPCSSYYLKIQTDSGLRELSWNGCKGRINDKLQQLSEYIISIIEAKEDYKKLPLPRGGYL